MIVFLVVWESHYGDEGEGRDYIGVFQSEADALLFTSTARHPKGYSADGEYVIAEITYFEGGVYHEVR